MLALLRGDDGASLADLTAATGWLPHSMRAALTGLRKKGHAIVRDKIAASKRKGLWMGGPVPLGYVVRDRKLVIHEEEAERVLSIYRRYLEMDSVDALAAELNALGYRTKVQQRASGPHRGGCIFRRGTLYHLLANRIYIGQLVHKGEHFAGEHEAIVPAELWDAVQAKLKAGAQGIARRVRARQPSLLTGLLYDGEGRAMSPSHATKRQPGRIEGPGKRYRYYCTRPDLIDRSPAWRVPAHDIEWLVCAGIEQLLTDSSALQRDYRDYRALHLP